MNEYLSIVAGGHGRNRGTRGKFSVNLPSYSCRSPWDRQTCWQRDHARVDSTIQQLRHARITYGATYHPRWRQRHAADSTTRGERGCRAKTRKRSRRGTAGGEETAVPASLSLYRAMHVPPRSNFIMIYVKIFHDAALLPYPLCAASKTFVRDGLSPPSFRLFFSSPSRPLLLQHAEKYLALVRGLARGGENKLGPLTRGLWGARPKFNAFPGPWKNRTTLPTETWQVPRLRIAAGIARGTLGGKSNTDPEWREGAEEARRRKRLRTTRLTTRDCRARMSRRACSPAPSERLRRWERRVAQSSSRRWQKFLFSLRADLSREATPTSWYPNIHCRMGWMFDKKTRERKTSLVFTLLIVSIENRDVNDQWSIMNAYSNLLSPIFLLFVCVNWNQNRWQRIVDVKNETVLESM